jgi:hypothetical protein
MNKFTLAFLTFLIIIPDAEGQWEILIENENYQTTDFFGEEVGWITGNKFLAKTEVVLKIIDIFQFFRFQLV